MNCPCLCFPLINKTTVMKSAYRSVMFYIGQKELEMQYKMNTIIGQCRQKCEAMQAKFTEKLEQVHTAYQKAAKRCQMMEQEIDNLSKDKQELQEKYAEKSRFKSCGFCVKKNSRQTHTILCFCTQYLVA